MAERAIRRLRKKLCLTQEQMGELIGVKQNAVSQYESGDRKPDPDVAITILDLAEKHGFPLTMRQLYSDVD